ncbi:MAG: Holliday junction resolvase RuvX [Deltaproteobacteria bacterium]|nr:Holliday junction resolvase RuvX [Deltaproteobacteria bacterium]
MMVLALDPGSRRVGVALSDAGGSFAFAQPALEVVAGGGHFAAVARLALERRVERILVGLPLRLDGGEGPAAKAAREFAAAVERATGLPVELVDERFTTAQAHRELIAAGRRRKERRATVDSAAAALLLEAWLAAHREPGP